MRPSTTVRSTVLHSVLPALLALLAAAPPPGAQASDGDAKWVALDTSPPGTPAEIQLVGETSSEERTDLEVRIHGFWRTDVVGGDGTTYQRLDFPGLSPMRAPGAPELPEARRLLAVATDAPEARLVETSVAAQSFVSDIHVYPAPIPGEDEEWDPGFDPGPGDPDGTDEVFTIDPTIYTGSGIWPPEAGTDGVVEAQMGPVSGASVAGWPVAWDQGAKRLIVSTHVQFSFEHSGTVATPLTVTKLKDELYAETFLNWPEVGASFPFEPVVYHSRYLIVAQPYWWDELEPFVQLKKTQGYQVTVTTALPDVSAIRQVIASWYAAGDPGMDHYCLLVGDTQTIPVGTVTPGGETVPTDDVYGTVGVINGSKEVHVGRVSIDGEGDLENQLQKIIDYQVKPVPGARYDTALLVAHEQGYPGKYSGSHQQVLGASYSHPPSFLTAFGATGATNQQVTNFITAGLLGDGLGLVAYRGHGTTSTWSGWNVADEDWHSNNVIMLQNPVRPIVWAITCTNGNLDWGWGTSSDSIAEVWMEVPQGACASYAATRTTSTEPNHHLNETLFRMVYDHGITTHSMAITAAEASVWTFWPGHKNPWAYLLLGDPSMTIRRDKAAELKVLNLPSGVSMDLAGGEVSLQAVFGETGAPVVDGLLSFHKASFLHGEDDELSGALWLSESGTATLPLSFETPGTLAVMARDLEGNVVSADVPVAMGAAWTDLGNELPGADGAPALAGLGPVTPGSDVTVLLTGAQPNATAWMCFGANQLNLALLGGVLVPDIAGPLGLVIPLQTDDLGNLKASSTWPDAATSGTSLVMQAWFLDDSGPLGFTASNGLVARTP